MKTLYFFLPLLVIVLANSSCSSLFGNHDDTSDLDTVVAIKNLKHITVQSTINDSSSMVVNYWTDENGRPLYKKSEEYFVADNLDGFQRKWDENGRLIYEAQWSDGMPMEYMQEFYGNGQLKKKIYYDRIKRYPQYEVNFHENGELRTDTILYDNGKKEGIINYYTDEGTLKESHIYSKDSLIQIKIYRKEYQNLAQMVEYLKRSFKRDSMNRLAQDSMFAALLGELENTDITMKWSDDYNKIEELKYLERLLGRMEDSTQTSSEE